MKDQKKGLPSCAGRTRRPLDPRRARLKGRPYSFCSNSHPCWLICDIHPCRPRDICGPVSARRSQLSIRGWRCLHRPPPVPVPLPSPISVHDPEESLDCIFCRHRLLFFSFSAEEFSTIQVGVPLLCPPPSRLGGSVADTWLGQLAPGLAVETWSPTAAASPSLHSAPLRLKLLTHPRGANSNPGSPSAATAYYCVASPAQHPPEPPTPRPRQTLPSLPRT